jgi:hypothetical protein
MPPSILAEHLYSYQSDAAGIRTILATAEDGTGAFSLSNQVGYWNASGVLTVIFTPSNMAYDLRAVFSRDYMYFCDHIRADLLKWTYLGTEGASPWGVIGPASGLLIGGSTSGLVTLVTGRTYYVVFYDPITQNYSDLSPASASTGPATLQEFPLTAIPVSINPNYTRKKILATADGNDPTVLYEDGDIPNADTTFTDNIPETTLLLNNVWQYTDTNGIDHGVAGNTPPPNGSFPIKHQGRLFMAAGNILQFSKSLDELVTSTGNIAGRYEEDWPFYNAIDISEDAENIQGLLSDGTTLYIGTELCVRRLTGNSAQNFAEPTVLFNDVGVMAQDVWQVVFLEGTPVGTMWMTPDFRVLGSDFNTYDNVGIPIQNILNTINPNSIDTAWAISPQLGPYSFYVLAIPTGTNTVPDTLCVYDMRLRKWYIWQCLDQFKCGLFYISLAGTPRWIVCDETGTIRNFDPSFVMDRETEPSATGITSVVQSTWLDLGENMTRKSLNEVEIQTSDPNLLTTVQGASTATTFLTPTNLLVSNVGLTQNAFGDYKVFLAGTLARDRFFQYQVTSTSNANSEETDEILGELSFEVIPFNRI